MTVTSLMMSTPPTMNNRAKGDGPLLISASKRPELDDRMRSRDFEKWWVQSNPDSRCATENEKASLEQVDRESEQRLEQECADHDGAQQDEEPLGCVNADRAGDFEGAVEVGVGLNRFGLNDQPDHRDDDREPKISTMLLVKMLNSKNTERLRSC